jgi:hypothetical protein
MAVSKEYSADEVSGDGILIDVPLSASGVEVPYSFIIARPSGLSGSAYFTLETKRNNDGNYSGSTANVLGTYDFSIEPLGTGGFVTSSFIASINVNPTPDLTSSFQWTPNSTQAANVLYIRATGGCDISLYSNNA